MLVLRYKDEILNLVDREFIPSSYFDTLFSGYCEYEMFLKEKNRISKLGQNNPNYCPGATSVGIEAHAKYRQNFHPNEVEYEVEGVYKGLLIKGKLDRVNLERTEFEEWKTGNGGKITPGMEARTHILAYLLYLQTENLPIKYHLKVWGADREMKFGVEPSEQKTYNLNNLTMTRTLFYMNKVIEYFTGEVSVRARPTMGGCRVCDWKSKCEVKY